MAELIEVMKETARAAGQILLKHFRNLKSSEVEHKSDIDLVSVADYESQKFIEAELRRTFPEIDFLGEEQCEQKDLNKGRFFVVDPLDGTVNFIHGLDDFGVIIGYTEDGVPKAGVIYLPITDALYWAVAGQGAWCGDRRVHVSAVKELKDAFCGTGFSCVRDHCDPDNSQVFHDMLYQMLGMRWTGSAAMSYCKVADGAFDAYWEVSLCPWDYAAGALLVQEAGGTVTNLAGEPFRWDSGKIIADNGLVHKALLQVMKEHGLA